MASAVPSPSQVPSVVPIDDRMLSAVPIRARKRRKSMSRRIGQNGTLEVRNGAYRGRWLEDVPGRVTRLRRSVVIGFVGQMTKSEARRKLRRIVEDAGVNSETYVVPSVESFERRVTWWEKNYLSRQKPSTQKTMAYHVRKYLLPKWGKRAADGIDARMVNEWIGELAHLSPMSIRHLVSTLSLILGRSFGRKEIHYPASVRVEDDAVCYSLEQMAQIIESATGQWKFLFATAAETGCRAGEIYALEVSDIDFVRNVIHVRKAVWEGQVQSPKSRNASRAIDIQPALTEMLKVHLNGRTQGLVFRSKNNKPLRNNNVLRRRLHPLLRSLGITDGGMHGFRHGRVSFLVENNTPVEVIKAWIGHGSERMVKKYTHLRPQFRSRILSQIPAIMTQIVPQGAVESAVSSL
jgi:integrase